MRVRLRTQIASAASYAERPCRPAARDVLRPLPARSWRSWSSRSRLVFVDRVLVGSPTSRQRASSSSDGDDRAANGSRRRRPQPARSTRLDCRRLRVVRADSRSSGRQFDDGVDVGTLDVPVDYADPDGPDVRAVPRPPPRRRARRTDRLAAREPRRARIRRQRPRHRRRARALRRGAARPVRHHRVGSSRHRRRASRRSTASTTTTASSPSPTSRPTTPQEQQAARRPRRGVRRRLRRQQRRHPPARRHEQHAPATSTPSAAPSARSRSRTSGSATAASSARRGRRCSPTRCGRRCSTAPPTRTPIHGVRAAAAARFRGRARRRSSPSAAPTGLRVPQRRRRRGRVRRADGRARRESDPGRPDRPDVNRGVGPARDLRGDVQAQRSYWPAFEESLAAARAGDGSGLLAFADSYLQRRADGTLGNELEAFRAINCADTTERLDRRGGGRVVGASTPRSRPVSRRPARPAATRARSSRPRSIRASRSPAPERARSSSSAPRATRRRRSTSTQAMAEALEDGRLVVVEADQHTGYDVNSCINDVVNDYLVDLVPPDNGTECR